MKTYQSGFKSMFSLGAVLALAMLASLPATARADDPPMKPMKGAEHLMMLHHVDTCSMLGELKPGDSVAMVCTMCKSVMVHTVTTEKGHIKTMTVGEKHLCPGCNSTIAVVGTGKGKNDVVTHTCEKWFIREVCT